MSASPTTLIPIGTTFCGKPNLYFPPPLNQEKRHRKRHSPGHHTSANSNRCFSVNFAPLVTRDRLAGAKTRLRGAAEIDQQIKAILDHHHVSRYLKVSRIVRGEHLYKQTRRGRPGPNTAYRKVTKRRFDIEWTIDEATIAYDHVSDGMYPLITNDRTLSPAQVLEAHKGQPMIEKRFEQIKTVHEIAPVFLKNEGRIEALFTLYFLALLVQALIERELSATGHWTKPLAR
jgi:hypothetical protein